MTSSVVSDNFETSTGAIPTLGGDSVETRLCRAWVNFNGEGTVAIRDSYNISSLTDRGTGLYTISFLTAMSDANYSAVANGALTSSSNPAARNRMALTTGYTTTAMYVNTFTTADVADDVELVVAQVFGN